MFVDVPAELGYPALAFFVGAESAGVPMPGEAALTAAALLAHHGVLNLWLVIIVAAVAATLGDNVGYWVGRKGGRAFLLSNRGPFPHHRHKLVARGEQFFERFGPWAVVLGRFVSGVRTITALVAGASGMRPLTFAIANCLGAFAWAGVTAWFVWQFGPVGAVIVVTSAWAFTGLGALYAAYRLRRSGRDTAATPADPAATPADPAADTNDAR